MNCKRIWVFIFSILSVLFSGCTNVFYQPLKQHLYTPNDYPVSIKPIDITFASRGGPQLHAWWFAQPNIAQSKGTIIQYHGNAENISTHVTTLLWVLNHGYNLFTFDYRGYGKSGGAPYVSGVHLDGVAALDEVVKLIPESQPLYVVGQSLGGTIALSSVKDSPQKNRVKSMVVEGTFYTYKQIAARKLRDIWFLWPFSWLPYLLVSNDESPKYTLKKFPEIPLLVMHSEKDPIIPTEYGRLIYKKAHQPKCLWIIPEAGHVGLTGAKPATYRPLFLDFLENHQCPAE